MSKELRSHPSTAVMVQNALEVLHNRRGTSFYAIKQYVFTTYPSIDPARTTPFIKKFLENAITNGQIVRTRGTGMAASFKLVPANKTSSKNVKKLLPKEGDDEELEVVASNKPKKTEPSTTNKAGKSAVSDDQKAKKKKVSITATKIRKGASKVAKQ